MVKFGLRVRTWESLTHAKFCKNDLRGFNPQGKIYNNNFHILTVFFTFNPTFLFINLYFSCCRYHSWLIKMFKVTMVKFGASVRTWDSLPTPNFIKSLKGIGPLWANFHQKFEIFASLSYLSPHYVKIWRNVRNIRNPSPRQNFVRIALLHMACRHCIASEWCNVSLPDTLIWA